MLVPALLHKPKERRLWGQGLWGQGLWVGLEKGTVKQGGAPCIHEETAKLVTWAPSPALSLPVTNQQNTKGHWV